MAHAGHVAVMTGGAGGIGMACAEMWVAEGGMVVVCDINDAKGEAFAASHPEKMVFMHCDTTDQRQMEAAAAAAKELGCVTARPLNHTQCAGARVLPNCC